MLARALCSLPSSHSTCRNHLARLKTVWRPERLPYGERTTCPARSSTRAKSRFQKRASFTATLGLESSMAKPKCIIVPGNGGGGDIRGSNFYGWAELELQNAGYEVRLPEGGMPDPLRARENIWIPYIRNELGCDENSVLIGHSSGAAAAMRFAEQYKVFGIILVATYDSDLGDELERKSGYFSRPWDWEKIKENAGFILQFSGAQDNLVPIEVQRRVAQALDSQYHEDANGDHFFEPPFPQLISLIQENVNDRA